jgi:hypothetical protein
MALLNEPERYAPEWLTGQLREIREELERRTAMIARDTTARANPAAMEFARGIAQGAVSLADAVLATPSPAPELLGRTINELYEVRNVLPLLYRSANTALPALRGPPAPPVTAAVPALRPSAPGEALAPAARRIPIPIPA